MTSNISTIIHSVRDQQNYCVRHSDGLPSLFAFYFSVLNTQVEQISKHQNGGFKADAVLPLVGAIFSPSQVNYTSILSNYKYVYTLHGFLRKATQNCSFVAFLVGRSSSLR